MKRTKKAGNPRKPESPRNLPDQDPLQLEIRIKEERDRAGYWRRPDEPDSEWEAEAVEALRNEVGNP